MKFLYAIFLTLLLSACGLASADAPEPAPVGIHADSSLIAYYAERLKEVQECTGINKGSVEELSIVIVRKDLVLFGNPKTTGLFTPPNLITLKMVNYDIDKHEFIHFLLLKETGDHDPDHRSPLYEKCSS